MYMVPLLICMWVPLLLCIHGSLDLVVYVGPLLHVYGSLVYLCVGPLVALHSRFL